MRPLLTLRHEQTVALAPSDPGARVTARAVRRDKRARLVGEGEIAVEDRDQRGMYRGIADEYGTDQLSCVR